MFDGDSRPKSVPQGFANTQKQEEGPERQRRQRVSRRPFLFVGDGFGDPLPLLSGGPPSGSRVLVKPSDTGLGRESPSRTVLYWTVLYCRNQVSLYRVESGLKKGESPGCTKAGTTSSTVHPGADGPPGTPVSTGPRGLAWDEDDQ